MDYTLILLTFSPLVGFLVLLFLKEEQKTALRWVALITSLVTFALSLWALAQFRMGEGGLQLVFDQPWFRLAGSQVTFAMGVDGLGVLMVLLTTFLTPLALLSTWSAVQERVKGFMIFFLLLETGMLGVFTAQDLVLFYIFWEFTLIPMYFLIGIWGGERRVLCGGEVLPLHHVRLGANAPCHPLPGTDCWHLLFERFGACPSGFCRGAGVALAGVCAGICYQSPHVAPAHLVARCACGSAYGGLGHSGRCLAEDGFVRFPSFQPAAFPGSHGATGPLHGGVGGHRDFVRRGGFLRPDGCQKTGGLFLGQPFGLCHAGNLRSHGSGDGRKHFADGQSWAEYGRPLPAGGYALRTPPYPPDVCLRRYLESGACFGRSDVVHQPFFGGLACA